MSSDTYSAAFISANVGPTLSDATTTTAPNIFPVKHITSGTAAAGFGVTEPIILQSGSGNTPTVSTQVITLLTATDAAETAQLAINLMVGGTLATQLLINSAVAPLEIPTRNASLGDALVFSMNQAQNIRKSGSGDLQIYAGANQAIYLVSNGTTGFFTKNGAIQFFGASGGATQQHILADMTNNTTGGTANTLTASTSNTVYATDAAGIQGNFNQIGLKLHAIDVALKAYGLVIT